MNQNNLAKLLASVEKALKKNNSLNVWDEFIPVVSKENKHYVYLTSEIESPNYYNKLCHLLYAADESEEFLLTINCLGGILDSAFMIIDAIKNTKGRVTCKLIGTVASSATIIALTCDEIITSSNLSFMIHNYSAVGMQGKGHEMKARQTFVDKELNRSFKEYYLGFLSEEEINDVIEGKDIWLNNDEVSSRWEIKKGRA